MCAALPYKKGLHGIDPYIPGKRLEEVVQELGLRKVIKLASNENPLGCSPRVKEAAAAALQSPSRYPDGGSSELKAELSRQTGLRPQQFVIGAGSFELIAFVAETFIGPGDEAIMPEPSFSWYGTVTKLQEGRIIQVPLTEHRVDLDAVKREITDHTRVIWLCNPNNPTGTIFTHGELSRFLKDIPPSIVVAMDEAYCDFVTGEGYPDTLDWIGQYPNLIVLRTFSKIYGLASLRIGYAAASEETADYMNRCRQIFNVNAVAQASALAGLKDAGFRETVYENNRQGKEYLYQAFEEQGLRYIPTEASFIMVRTGQDSETLYQQLLKEGVIIRPGAAYGMKEWLRVSIGTMEENRLFIEALRKVLKAPEAAGSLKG
ncbi:histidinol-phosphate aminotransferase [Paenibacillus forsythiae]|uniref:Histidinol-phosphate aminotransferase n=1 Tax=Paenibacillus forsythiae TaxID=365616 RepID=A0ABU3H564_9BACL|nr:histidinol-phosphate transaminase [Paenibacillus forsythiae]MDT3425871.1 histidinol-phosphate aminotransferase [Paenibacillus forsythiae]